jgi:hypothetical protein
MLQCLFPEAFPQRWTETYLATWKKKARPSSDDIAFFEEASAAPKCLFFAVYDEKLLGHTACRSQDGTNDAWFQMRVLPSFSDHGIESWLLSTLFDLAAFKHWAHLLVPCSDEAHPAADFFLSCGGLAMDGGKAILLNPPVRVSRIDTFGSFVDELIVTNIQMWHVQERLYEPESLNAMSRSDMLHLLHRGTWLNLVRNRCIDNLDATLNRMLQPSTPENETANEIPLVELLEHAKTHLVEFAILT